jgi:hypothetical protein
MASLGILLLQNIEAISVAELWELDGLVTQLLVHPVATVTSEAEALAEVIVHLLQQSDGFG